MRSLLTQLHLILIMGVCAAHGAWARALGGDVANGSAAKMAAVDEGTIRLAFLAAPDDALAINSQSLVSKPLSLGVAALALGLAFFLAKRLFRSAKSAPATCATCRIPALLRLGTRGGDPIIDGLIVMLDEKCARFELDGADGNQHAVSELNDLPVSMIAVNFEIPALLSRVEADSVGLFFEVPLPEADLQYILSHSTVEQRRCPAITDAPNIQEHIRRPMQPARRISFEELSSYRRASSAKGNRRQSDAEEADMWG